MTRKPRPTLTPQELFCYDADAGTFTWKVRRPNGASPGSSAGSLDQKGHLRLRLGGKAVMAHRVAWFLFYGEWPLGEVDHINGNKADNRIANLRVVTTAENAQNRSRPNKGNRSGFLGVSRRGESSFRALITVNRKVICLGTFDSPEIAHAAYVEAKRRLHPGCTI